MQKRLIKDTQAEIAKNVYAFGRSENIKIYMDEEEKCFNQKEVKIEVFKRQFQHWFFDAAEILKENEDNDFVLMMICAAYIEAIQQYKTNTSTDITNGKPSPPLRIIAPRGAPIKNNSKQAIESVNFLCHSIS